MDYDNYINKLFAKYIYNSIFNDNFDKSFSEYDDIIVKNNESYINVGNNVKQEILSESQDNILKKYYKNNIFELNDEIKNIFNIYLKNINANYKEKYYFSINNGDINPDNIVDYNTIVLIINIKIDYKVNYNVFIEKYSKLKRLCNRIEKDVKCDKGIKIKFLYNLLDNVVNI